MNCFTEYSVHIILHYSRYYTNRSEIGQVFGRAWLGESTNSRGVVHRQRLGIALTIMNYIIFVTIVFRRSIRIYAYIALILK